MPYLGAGGVGSILGYCITKKDAEASVLEKVQGIYQKLTEDLISDRDRLREEYSRISVEIINLRQEVASIRPWLCYRLHCHDGRLLQSETKAPPTP